MRKSLYLNNLIDLFYKYIPSKDEYMTRILVKINNETHQIYEDQCLFQLRPKAPNEQLGSMTEQSIILDMDNCMFLSDLMNKEKHENNDNAIDNTLGDVALLSSNEPNNINKVKVDQRLMNYVFDDNQKHISFNDLTDKEKEKIYLELCDYLGADYISVSIVKTDKGVELKIDDPNYES